MPTIAELPLAGTMTDDDVVAGNDGTTGSRWLATTVKTYMTTALVAQIADLDADLVIQAAFSAGNATAIFDLQNVVTALAQSTSNTRTASYTFVLADGAIPFITVVMNVATANTLTIPPNASVAFPVGTILAAEQHGAGLTTWTQGAGVTINSRGGLLAMGGQYAAASARKTATNTWLLSGDLG